MEFAKKEVEVVAKTTEKALQDAVIELNGLELALVGGGIGDTIPH